MDSEDEGMRRNGTTDGDIRARLDQDATLCNWRTIAEPGDKGLGIVNTLRSYRRSSYQEKRINVIIESRNVMHCQYPHSQRVIQPNHKYVNASFPNTRRLFFGIARVHMSSY